MGGAVSSGRDNSELVDNLLCGKYIRTRTVERVFRVLDRADYMIPHDREQAHKDVAWRHGLLHLSAPCIYSEVMESLELKPGLSFLNIGSGTGYLSTMVSLILGSSGISHGVEVHLSVVEYANRKKSQFYENSAILDEFDFCEPKYFHGNGLCLAPLQSPYDRVYCGASCPEEYQNVFKQLIKVGGILVMPLNDNLLQIKRTSPNEWVSRSLLNVSFATLRMPASKEEAADLLKLDEQTPVPLQQLCRGVVREAMRGGVLRRHPELREPYRPPPTKPCPRRICIPVDDDLDIDELNALHDLESAEGGSREMNALLSLVLSAEQNRVAGALRFDDQRSSDELSSDEHSAAEDGAPAAPGTRQRAFNRVIRRTIDEFEDNARRWNVGTSNPSGDGVVMFELRDSATNRSRAPNTSDTPDSSSSNVNPESTSTDTDRSNTDSKTTDTTPDREPSTSSGESTRHDGRGFHHTDGDRNVPSEVEIYLRKWKKSAPGTSTEMDWEEREQTEVVESSEKEDEDEDEDEEEEEEVDVEEGTTGQKRVKLDSGIGENSASPGSSSAPEPKTDESDATTDAQVAHSPPTPFPGMAKKRSRRTEAVKRAGRVKRHSTGARAGPATPTARGSGRRHPTTPDGRRVRLSYHMKQAVKELPLPHVLRKYVNLGRCYQF